MLFKESENKYFKNRFKKIEKDINIIGIIGSRGKTSTGIVMYKSFNKLGIETSFIGDYYYINNHEYSINNLTDKDIYNLIFDSYSMNISNIIIELNDIDIVRNIYANIKFDTLVFTNINNNFKKIFGSMNNYLKNYKHIFSKLKLDGISIVNIDDPYGLNFIKGNSITYGFDEGDYFIDKYVLKDNDTLFTYNKNNTRNFFKLNIIGKNNIYNVMPTIILLNSYGIKVDDIYKTILDIKIPFRNELIEYGKGIILLDSATTLNEVITVINTAKIFKRDIYVVLSCNNNMTVLTEFLLKNTKRCIIANNGLKYGIDDINNLLKGNTLDNYEVILNKNDAILRGLSYIRSNGILLILGKNNKDIYGLIKESKKIKIDSLICNK